ncbi:MAG TPA: TonB-dependent receptor, partial [Methylococcaceae bacterium]|nr:TonB-dependent receptor [Methylococcaceae bacterium]
EPEQAEEPPPGENLGVDADGAAGGDSFGLVGKKGGSGFLGGGG